MIGLAFALLLASVSDHVPTSPEKRHVMERVEAILIQRGFKVQGYSQGPMPAYLPGMAGPASCWDEAYAVSVVPDALAKAGVTRDAAGATIEQVIEEIGAETEDKNCMPESAD